MPDITIQRYASPRHTPAEALWAEGMAHLVGGDLTPHGRVTLPPANTMAWVVFVDGLPAAVSLRYIHAAEAEAEGCLTFVRPQYRGLRLYALVQQRMDADLLAMGITHIRCVVVDDPLSTRIIAHILRRGGEALGEETLDGTAGPIKHLKFRRPLREGV